MIIFLKLYKFPFVPKIIHVISAFNRGTIITQIFVKIRFIFSSCSRCNPASGWHSQFYMDIKENEENGTLGFKSSSSPHPQPNSAHVFSLKGKHVTEGVTKRCRLSHSLLTNSALAKSLTSPNAGDGGELRAAVHITWHGAQIDFGDLPPYLTYAYTVWSEDLTWLQAVTGTVEQDSLVT